MHLKRQLVLSLFALHSVAALAGQTRPAVPRYDLAIVGGRLIDGTGAPARRADLAIAGGAIAAIGTVNRQDAREIIDATNLAVAPGFIDVHTHADDLGGPSTRRELRANGGHDHRRWELWWFGARCG